MESGLRGKRALITGGASGIGKGISTALAKEGVDLVIASRNPSQKVINKLKENGIKCFGISADVSKEEEVIGMVNQAKIILNGIDIFINNAAWIWHQPVTKITTDAFYNTINTNLAACIWACREVSKLMIKRNRGNILIVGSTSRCFPCYSETVYRISKMGLYMYMQNLAIELAPHGIRVNMVTPGHFETRMTGNISGKFKDKLKEIIPLGRFGETIEIGYAAVMLISDKLSGYTTGSDIIIDGGLSLRPISFSNFEEIKRLNL